MEDNEKRVNTPPPAPDPQFDFRNGFYAQKNP